MLRNHFDSKPLVIAERFHFHRWDQAPGKSISNYVTELRRLATHCDFGGYLEQALRDRLVCGIRHKNTQKRLLSEANLTLKKAIEVACNVEAAEGQTNQLKGASDAPVMTVDHSKRGDRRSSDTPADKRGKCTRCGGGNHKAKDYHHKNAKCYKCYMTGHLSSVCRSTTANPGRGILNMLDGLKNPHNRTMTLTVLFFKFQRNLLTHLQWN